MRTAVLALVMLLAMGRNGWAAHAPAGSPAAQHQVQTAATAVTAGPAREFEVATIKPSDPAQCCSRTYGMEGRKIATNNTYLQWLIKWAYGLQDKQIVGGPAWIGEARYDVTAQASGSETLTIHDAKRAMQKLLADRFQLKFHHETREMSAYVLTVAHGGPKLTPSNPAIDTVPQVGFSGAIGQTMHGSGRNVTLHEFMGEIQRIVLDRPVVDHTGLTGTYDMNLQFTREDQTALGMAELPENAAPNLLTALNQQLGLKLAVEKTAVDVIVIDHAEPPSAD
ncbi:MAG TPA: TIGR03435 family protein [Acidobacteriaceae bacterium]|nr:TIGR03435 family protein [Acidobacteriaceae bacterium]